MATMIVHVGIMPVDSLAATGWKPLKAPVWFVCSEMGVQGASKVDWETLWLPARNWNWTISPAGAWILSGVNTSELFDVATETTWTVCAEARPKRAEIASVENCILILSEMSKRKTVPSF